MYVNVMCEAPPVEICIYIFHHICQPEDQGAILLLFILFHSFYLYISVIIFVFVLCLGFSYLYYYI